MKIELGTFARWSIETRLGSNVRAGVVAALLHYTGRLKSGQRPVPPPAFCCDHPGAQPTMVLEVQVGPGARAELERQAREHRISLSQLLTHAIFVYLVDLETSRV